MFSGRKFKVESINTLEFNSEYTKTSSLLDYKREYYDSFVKSKTNGRQINSVVDLPTIMRACFDNGIQVAKIKRYYEKYPVGQAFGAGSQVSIPVGDCDELRLIVLSAELNDKEKIERVIVFYVNHFASRSISQIIEDGFDPTQRNDFATSITQALPEGLLFKRMYDEFFQLKRNLKSIKDLIERAKTNEMLDDDVLTLQIVSVKTAQIMAHNLGTPENQAAAHLCILLEVAAKSLNVPKEEGDSPLSSIDYSPLAEAMKKDILKLTEKPSKFRDIVAIMRMHEKSIKAFHFHDESLRKTVLCVIDTAKTDIPIPEDEASLNILDRISEMRKRLVEYRVHMNLASRSKLVDAAIEKLDEFCTSIRTGVRHSGEVLSASGKISKEISEVKNLPQLIWHLKEHLPPLSKLPKELEIILDVKPSSLPGPVMVVTSAASASSSSSTPPTPYRTSSTEVLMVHKLVEGSQQEHAARQIQADEINLLRKYETFINQAKDCPEIMFTAMSEALPLFHKHDDDLRKKYKVFFGDILKTPLAREPKVTILIGQLAATNHSYTPTAADLAKLQTRLQSVRDTQKAKLEPSPSFFNRKK